LPLDSTHAEELSGYRPLIELNENAVILHRRGPQPTKLAEEKRQSLRAMFGTTPTDDPAKRIVVTVQFTGGDRPWLEKFRMLEIRKQQYGQFEIVAEYHGQDYSGTLPELRGGIRYIVPLDKVLDFVEE
jgi:hypothetical protein